MGEGAAGREGVRVAAQIFKFVSRTYLLRLRGQRNYSRYMQITKGFVDPDGPERAQWRKEDAQESMRDAEWNERHGPVPGGASILQWRHERTPQPSEARSVEART